MTEARMIDDPVWYREVKDAEAAELADRNAKELTAGTAAAQELSVQLRQLLPEAIGVEAHYQVTEIPGPRASRSIAPWAELRLADDVAVRIKARGSVWEIWVADPKRNWEVGQEPILLIHLLARVVDDVRKARAEQEEGERRAAVIREEQEARRIADAAKAERRANLKQWGVDRAAELGVDVYWVVNPDEEETDEEYRVRAEERFQEPLREQRREELGRKLRAAEVSAFTPLTLYKVSWPRSVGEDGTVDQGCAWSVRSEPDADGFYPVLALGQLRRRKILVSAGAIEVTEHVFESFDLVPGDAKVWETVEEDSLEVSVPRLAWCLRP